jgi:hypothetical protein
MPRFLAWALLPLVLVTCNGATAPGRSGETIVRFTNTGVTPRDVSVNQRSRLTFVNDDTREHRPASDPHPEHTLCAEFNLRTLKPGDRVQTQELQRARDCRFHDDLRRGDDNYTGRVLIGLQ